MDCEKIIDAIRENDRSAFADELKKVKSATLIDRPNPTPYANWFSGRGATLLQLTAFVRPEFAADLLEKGAAMDFHSACALGDVDSIKRWLSVNPSSIEHTVDTYYPIQFALRHPPALRMLLEHGENPNRSIKKLAWFEWEDQAANEGISDWRPIHMLALGRGDEPHIESAEVLRDFGADLHAASSPFGEAPIHLAAIYNRTHLIRWFVKNGCDVDTRTHDSGNDAVATRLFDPAPFAPFHTHHRTPLMLALGEGQTDAVSLLLGLGASVDIFDTGGFTPLHYASAPFWKEDPTQVELIINQGAKVNARDTNGRCPIDLAKEKGHDATVSVLARH